MYSKFKEYRLRRDLVVEIISIMFILLFMYAAVSKLLDYEQFRVQITQSPMLNAFADWIAWAVPSVEILVSLMLMVPRLRLFALFAAFSLMVMFTTYIFLLLNFSDYVPCSCGGVLEELGWTEHLVFNLGFIILSLLGIFFSKSGNKHLVFKEDISE